MFEFFSIPTITHAFNHVSVTPGNVLETTSLGHKKMKVTNRKRPIGCWFLVCISYRNILVDDNKPFTMAEQFRVILC